MTETETPKEEQPEQPEIDPFSPEGQEAIRNLLITLDGGNPRAQSLMVDFLKMNSAIERSFLPTRRDVQQVDYANYASKAFWPDVPNNPFADCANSICECWMPYKGEKSKQTVDLFKQTPTIGDIQSIGEQPNRNFLERMLGRGKEE